VIALFTLALAALVVSRFVPGSKPKFVHVWKHHSLPVDRTGWNDYARTGLWVAAAVLSGLGLIRWNAASEPLTDESDSRPRGFGDSIVDARTQVDPAIGIRPVDMSRDR
jgi:hypothetical protein